MALVITTWLWGEAYGLDYAKKLQAGVRRHLNQPRFVCVTDRPKELTAAGIEAIEIPHADRPLLQVKGCFARLRMFDPQWQRDNGITDRLVNIDLDTVITDWLDPLFERGEPFVIMRGGNAANPCKLNGALMMLRAGTHADVWQDFSLEAARRVPFYEFPDDQGWVWSKYPDAAGWSVGWQHGVYVFHKPGWPGWQSVTGYQEALPAGARLVTFSGWRTPERFKNLAWVRQHWRLDGRSEGGLPIHPAEPESLQT